MRNQDKTKEQLIGELAELRKRVVRLEASEADRAHTEEALRESEAKMRSIFRAAPIGIGVVSNRVLLDVNDRFCEITGYSRDELVGKNARMVYPTDEDYEYVGREKYRQIQGRGTGTVETRFKRKDGKIINVLLSSTPLDPTDLSAGVTFTALDITERKRAEEALRESERQFRDLYENAPNAYFSVGVDGLTHRCNRRATELLGYAAGDLVGRPVFDLYADTPQGKEKASQLFERFRAGEAIVDEELQMQKADGTLEWVSLTVNAVHDAQGQVVESRSMIVDITERKRAEEALQQLNRQLALLNRASQAFSSTLDLDQVLASVLEEVCRLLDVVAGSVWLIDQETNELVCRQATGPRSEIVRGWRLALDQGIAGWTARHGESLIVPDVQSDERHFRAVDEETGLTLRSSLSVPLWVKSDVIGVLQVVDTDADRFGPNDLAMIESLAASASIAIENARLHLEVIDHAERLEQRVQERTAELQAQYARLDAILSSTTDGIIVADGKGNITRANPVAQAWLTQTLSPEGAERLRQAVRDLAQRVDEQPEMVLELAGRDLELSAAPVVEESEDEPSAVVVDIHDITPLKALDRMRTMFINNVAHELRTPIATIQSYAYLARRTPPEEEKWDKYLDALVQEADAQAQLGEDILQISRIHAGRLEVKPRPTSLNELTEAAITHHRALAQERELALEYRPLEPGPVASVDPKQMTQVLNILMGDAIHYTPEGEQVVVSTGTEEAEGCVWATVAVSDTGEGILAEDLPHIFERFFREEEPRSVRVSETGLRLMIVKGIVELHGGRVTVESEKGVGSTFTVWLPLAS